MTIKAAQTQRMLDYLGHEHIHDALRHAIKMRTALKVIHTCAMVEGALDARQVRELTAKVLEEK